MYLIDYKNFVLLSVVDIYYYPFSSHESERFKEENYEIINTL